MSVDRETLAVVDTVEVCTLSEEVDRSACTQITFILTGAKVPDHTLLKVKIAIM